MGEMTAATFARDFRARARERDQRAQERRRDQRANAEARARVEAGGDFVSASRDSFTSVAGRRAHEVAEELCDHMESIVAFATTQAAAGATTQEDKQRWREAFDRVGETLEWLWQVDAEAVGPERRRRADRVYQQFAELGGQR